MVHLDLMPATQDIPDIVTQSKTSGTHVRLRSGAAISID